MKVIKKFAQKLNSTQRTLIGIIFPVIILIISIPIAEEINCCGLDDAFDLDETWWFWLIVVGVIGYVEFHLFSDDKKV